MNRKATLAIAASLIMAGTAGTANAQLTDPSPTCSDLEFLDIEVHGQHVVRDYVAGGGAATDWPPSDGGVGQIVGGNGGAALPGGPGPGFHFPNDVPPGASFCTDSSSWRALDD